MKKVFTILFATASLFFMGCDEETGPVFEAQASDETFTFLNEFASSYAISEQTEDNIADRLIWNSADFEVPSNVTYEIQGSIDPDFESFDIVGSTSDTNFPVLVSQLLEFAEALALDNDPNTSTSDGAPNNTGQVFFRVRAYLGTGAANAEEMMSDVQSMNVLWLEETETGGPCPSIFVVGAAAVDAGWDWGSPIEFTCEQDVYTARLELTNDNFRFFEIEGDWDSGLNYTYFEDEGYSIDELLENANDGDSNFSFVGTPGIYEVVVDGNTRTITLTPSTPLFVLGDAVPSGWEWTAPVQLPETSPYIRSATFEFNAGIFRFFTVQDDWGSGLNFPYYEDLGYSIDESFVNAEDGDSNFSFVGTPGTYTITINELERTITLE
ncbi:SusE domain-containing protein [Flagellimonas crocea]|uniref:SusE domain-containing protein n=1 Tax=Flagellimonas crocea TaxID=3067311 RepID=UPI0029700A9C|nr:SusF/SusE family outer membrane protein [Muricauda sp. DH64]